MSLNSLIRKLGVLSMAGGVAAVPLITALTLTGWGTPGTAAYQTYELLNRLMAFSLLLMMAGWMGLFLVMPRGYGRWAVLLALAGATFMVIGNAAEFWLFSESVLRLLQRAARCLVNVSVGVTRHSDWRDRIRSGCPASA